MPKIDKKTVVTAKRCKKKIVVNGHLTQPVKDTPPFGFLFFIFWETPFGFKREVVGDWFKGRLMKSLGPKGETHPPKNTPWNLFMKLLKVRIRCRTKPTT